MILTDVCAFTLGTETAVRLKDGKTDEGHFCPIIERNTVIPASRTERFYTLYDDQERVRICVLQGESRYAKITCFWANWILRSQKTKQVRRVLT